MQFLELMLAIRVSRP